MIPGVEITVGQDKDDGGRWPYAGTASAVEEMGAKHVNKEVHISFRQILQCNTSVSASFALRCPSPLKIDVANNKTSADCRIQ